MVGVKGFRGLDVKSDARKVDAATSNNLEIASKRARFFLEQRNNVSTNAFMFHQADTSGTHSLVLA